MKSGNRQPRWFWTTTGLVVLLTAFFLVWMFLGFGGVRTTRWFDDVGEGVTPAAAAVVCVVVAARRKEARASWALLGASAASWAAGEAVWCYYDIGLRVSVPFPSLADAGYLTAVPLAVAGLLLFPSAPRRVASRLRGLVDGVLIAGGLLFVSWATVLGPLYRTHQDTLLAKLLSLAYPAGDVVLASLVLILTVRIGRRRERGALMFVMAGIFAFALSDTSFAYLTQVHNYLGTLARVLDTGWFTGYLALGLGALWSLSASSVAETTQERVSRTSILVPYAPLALAGLVAVQRLVSHQSMGIFLSVEGLALVVVLSARQILTLFDNMSLNHRLNTKLEMGTAELRAREARFAALVQNSSDLVTIVDQGGQIRFQSPSVERVLGWRPEATTDSSVLTLVHPSDRRKWAALSERMTAAPTGEVVVEWRFRHTDTSWRYFQSVVTNMVDEPSVGGFVFNSRDITDQKALEDQLRHQAFHDPLTGLANRALFSEHLGQAVRRRIRTGAVLGVMFVDLDDFKAVNDLRGHILGDHILAVVAKRLQSALRDSDLVARLGGDEFAVLLEGVAVGEDLGVTAARLLQAVEEPISTGDTVVHLKASIGVTIDAAGCESAEDLLRNADLAMYAAKGAGKGSYAVYSPEMHSVILDRMEIEAELGQALERNELQIYFQPIVDMQRGGVDGVEALLRWQHPNRGLIAPIEFIGIAETSGLIIPIGSWVLREACREVQSWPEPWGSGLCLSVNLSARQIADPALPEIVRSALEDLAFEPSRLTLEITESMIMEDTARTVEVLGQLRALGVKIAIDDFGTGYSSLGSLRDLPVDTIKIDRSFVTDIVTNPDDTRLARTILQLANDLELHTVAEGVEQGDQLTVLTQLGCESVQGYFFGEPLPPLEVNRLLDQLEFPNRGAGGSQVGEAVGGASA